MKSRWLKGLNEKDKGTIAADVKSSATVLRRLATMLQEDIDSSVKAMASSSHFGSPSWEDRMSAYLGAQQAYRKVIDLINVEK